MIRIRTKTNKGEVFTIYSDDLWNKPGWHTSLTVYDPGTPIGRIAKLFVAKDLEQAGKNHLKLIELLK